MVLTVLPFISVVGFYQSAASPGQCRSDGPYRQPGLLGDFRIAETGIPEQ